jgi:hypothetical protein
VLVGIGVGVEAGAALLALSGVACAAFVISGVEELVTLQLPRNSMHSQAINNI